jgi:hypothetical protein
MDTVLRRIGLTHTGDASVMSAPQQAAHPGALGRLMLTMARATAKRLLLIQREPPPSEWYRFPLP